VDVDRASIGVSEGLRVDGRVSLSDTEIGEGILSGMPNDGDGCPESSSLPNPSKSE
jgi:hypothetical protein